MDQTPGQVAKRSSFSFAAFDMFGTPISFHIRGDKTYKTVLGCFWTFIMIISLIGAFIWYFLIFVEHKNGEISSTIETQDNYPKLDFEKTGFFFTISALRGKEIINLPANQTVFKVEASMNYVTRNANVTAPPTYYKPVNIPLERCDTAKANRTITDASGSSYQLEGVTDTQLSENEFCSVPTQYNPLFLEGTDDSDKYGYVRIMVSPCDVNKFTCIMFYEENNLLLYLKEISPIYASGISMPSMYMDSRPVCNTMMRPAARVFHQGFTGMEKAAYDQLLLDYENDSCTCGEPNERYGYADKLLFSNLQKPSDTTVTDNWRSYICFKLITGARTRLDEELSATSFRISYTEGSVKPDNFEKPFKFFLKKAASIRASQENTKFISLT